MAAATKYVHFFGNGKAEGRGDQKILLGGKGAGLAEMTNIGLPVPAGFTITTDACGQYYRQGKHWPAGLEKEIATHLTKLQKTCKKKLGDPKDPLLVSVRSGASVSMPGMMETILNLGLTDESVEGLARATGNRRFALDAYRRLIMMYGATAKGIDRTRFDDIFDKIKHERTLSRLGLGSVSDVSDTDINEAELEEVVSQFKAVYLEAVGEPFPQDPMDQLRGSIDAVFDSWMAEKAITYRRVENITGVNGTGVNICQMVFGNLGDDSGTGVCFTRDPSTGAKELYGDFLINAQGEDVVAGIRTPLKITEMAKLMPEAWIHLQAVQAMLELHYGDMQDLEFTVERGKLYMLQCRTGKRGATAAFKIAVDQATNPLLTEERAKELLKSKHLPKKYAAMAVKPVISREAAILRIQAVDIERLFQPIIDPTVERGELERRQLGTGINAVPGAASGAIVFNPKDAERGAAEGKNVILVRRETSPEDVGGMHAAVGILTATGGKTSHAAVVARGWGKCCIVGCGALRVDEDAKTMSLNGTSLGEGDVVTLDGTSGTIYEGHLPLTEPSAPDEFGVLLSWCDEIRRLRVRANADAPSDARKAIELGAEGIGLCRTEHMFFETAARRHAMQEMIVADTSEARREALDKLLPFQKEDFVGIFKAMDGRPVTIRLIDPPLHEFLPHTDEGIAELSSAIGVDEQQVRDRIEQLHESNPMLGHRGCRLCITYPEILEMQVSAIIEAALEVHQAGVTVRPEIMIPLIIDAGELEILVEKTRATADAILDNAGINLRYEVGTMVETPRAALVADKVAGVAKFISFGTNDLTQMTMGLSRDDSGRFLPEYVDADKYGILAEDPFQTLDQDGVGLLVAWAVEKARSTDKNFKLGVCGEHGGDPDSIRFFHNIGLQYVSCSPFRVPVARLAAAQAELESKQARKVAARSKKASAKSNKAAARTKKVSKGGTRKKKVVKKVVRKAAKKAVKKVAVKKVAKKKAAKTVAKKASAKKKAGRKKVAKKASRKTTAKKKAANKKTVKKVTNKKAARKKVTKKKAVKKKVVKKKVKKSAKRKRR